MHAQLGQILDKRYKRLKKPNCYFWKAGSKNRVLGARAGYCTCPLHSTLPKGWANHLSHASCPAPGHTPTLTPYKEPARPAPPCCSRGPSKALPEFLVWPLINSYCLGKVKNPGCYQYDLLYCVCLWCQVYTKMLKWNLILFYGIKTIWNSFHDLMLGILAFLQFKISIGLHLSFYVWLFKWHDKRTSLVAQWWRIHLPMQGTRVWALVRKIPHAVEQLSPCATTTKPEL